LRREVFSGLALAVIAVLSILALNAMPARAGDPPEDLNNDGVVNMDDLFIAALAFGSYPGHSRWNPVADLNQDDQVDMKDMAMIAKRFGWKKEEPDITGTLRVGPQALNLRSKGRWITVSVEFEEECNVSGVVVSSIMLNESISPERALSEDNETGALMLKFSRQAVQTLILESCQSTGKFGAAALTIQGKLVDGRSFRSSDYIKVIF
jgi:hypothetical protein